MVVLGRLYTHASQKLNKLSRDDIIQDVMQVFKSWGLVPKLFLFISETKFSSIQELYFLIPQKYVRIRHDTFHILPTFTSVLANKKKTVSAVSDSSVIQRHTIVV